MTALYLVLFSLMAVGLYEAVKGVRGRDWRSAGVWGVIAVAMIGLMLAIALVPPDALDLG